MADQGRAGEDTAAPGTAAARHPPSLGLIPLRVPARALGPAVPGRTVACRAAPVRVPSPVPARLPWPARHLAAAGQRRTLAPRPASFPGEGHRGRRVPVALPNLVPAAGRRAARRQRSPRPARAAAVAPAGQAPTRAPAILRRPAKSRCRAVRGRTARPPAGRRIGRHRAGRPGGKAPGRTARPRAGLGRTVLARKVLGRKVLGRLARVPVQIRAASIPTALAAATVVPGRMDRPARARVPVRHLSSRVRAGQSMLARPRTVRGHCLDPGRVAPARSTSGRAGVPARVG